MYNIHQIKLNVDNLLQFPQKIKNLLQFICKTDEFKMPKYWKT